MAAAPTQPPAQRQQPRSPAPARAAGWHAGAAARRSRRSPAQPAAAAAAAASGSAAISVSGVDLTFRGLGINKQVPKRGQCYHAAAAMHRARFCALLMLRHSPRPAFPQVLAGASLEVPRGSFHMLLGANGCGKSTLLRVMAGLFHPDAGSIRGGCLSVAADSTAEAPWARCHSCCRGLLLIYAIRRPIARALVHHAWLSWCCCFLSTLACLPACPAARSAVDAPCGFVFQNPDHQVVMPSVGADVAFGLGRCALGGTC